MTIEPINTDSQAIHFLSGDLVSNSEYILIDSNKNIIINGKTTCTDIPVELSMPQVSIIDKKTFLISEYDTNPSNTKSKNAWIINEEGHIIHNFNIGLAYKIVSTDHFIIASYCPADFYTGVSPEFEAGGLAVFDLEGNCLFHLDPILQREIHFHEIKAMTNHEDGSVHLLTFPNNDILKLNLNDFELSIEVKLEVNETNVEPEFWNPNAISKYNNEWYFLTPHAESACSFIYKRGADNKITRIGKCKYSPFPKGLKNGAFFVPSRSLDQTVVKSQFVKCG